MRKAILSLTDLTPSKRRTLSLVTACLVGMALLFGVGIGTAETQTSPSTTYYDVQDLGTLGGSEVGWVGSIARGINGSGKVIGHSITSDGYYHAFLYDESATPKMQELGTLGGHSSYATGINDSGQVVGYSLLSDGDEHAFLYDSTNGMQDLNNLIPADSGGTIYEATAINSEGKIAANDFKPFGTDPPVCQYENYSGGWIYAAVLTPATTATYEVQDLGTLGGDWSEAKGINDSDQVVGYSMTSGCLQDAILYDESATPKKMQDLGTLGGPYSEATGINDSSGDSAQVVGYSSLNYQSCSNISGCSHAILYDASADTPKMQDLGTLGGDSSAWDINDSGKVVGYSYVGGAGDHAFVTESGKPMIDLNTLIPAGSGWTINEARAINNTDGKIAANGYKDGVGSHALLLTPTSDSPPPADSKAPSPPTVTSPADNSYDDDGNITFSGTVEKGSTVKVYQDGATTAAGQATASTTDGSWTINLTGVSEQSTAHTFDFTATNAAGNESTATTRHVTVGPYAPSGLTASQNGTTNNQYIKLAWRDNSDSEKNFTVERCTGSSSYCASQGSWSVRTSTLPANTQSYTDTGLSRRTTYTYRVKATNDAASSAYSNTASATTK